MKSLPIFTKTLICTSIALLMGCSEEDNTKISQNNDLVESNKIQLKQARPLALGAKALDEAFILDTSIWPNKRISVCWENPNADNLLGRNTVRLAILNTWEKHSGVRFFGWDQCHTNSEGIRINIIDEVGKGPAVVGGLGNNIKNMRLNFTYNNWGTSCQGREEYCTKVISVHEFGHALGFAHEQNREDTPNPACAEREQGSDGNIMIGAWDINSVMNYCNPKYNNHGQLSDTDIVAVQKYYGMPLSYEGFGRQRSGWRVERHPRIMADVNGDGRDDIVGFGYAGAYVALSNGSGFDRAKLWTDNFGYRSGWRVQIHPRYLKDVNGDGMMDIVGFSDEGVKVSLSTGESFQAPEIWHTAYGLDRGNWNYKRHPRVVADVNGDGLADIVGFGHNGVSVSLSDGTRFVSSGRWSNDFGYGKGWRVPTHPRYLKDVNGDGMMDIVGFSDEGVKVSLSTGESFQTPEIWHTAYGLDRGHWNYKRHPRAVADVNGDGLADIVGFGHNGVSVSLSDGTRFVSSGRWSNDFGYGKGWRVPTHPRYLKDVNGDGMMDIVGIADDGVYVARSTGSSFLEPELRVKGYSPDTSWTAQTPLTMADTDGDGESELVGFYFTGVSVFDQLH